MSSGNIGLIGPIGLILLTPLLHAGPFSDEEGGIPPDAAAWRSWVSRVVDVRHPEAGSGGYARDDDGLVADATNAVLGRPEAFDLGGTTRHVLSLGNGGSVVVSFDTPIHDGPGPDFAVFENGFRDASDWTATSREGATNSFSFAELAFVDVATETSAWARLPCAWTGTGVLHNLNNLEENRFASQDVSLMDGLAGKHTIGYGTPFDLAALTNNPAVLSGAVRLDNIEYVRLTDVIGDGSATDSIGRAIFDPYYHFQDGYPVPAPVASQDGFDLRGVGVINAADVSVAPDAGGLQVQWYATAGTVYQVESADAPGGPWSPLGQAVTGLNAWVGFPVDGSFVSRCYRVSRWRVP